MRESCLRFGSRSAAGVIRPLELLIVQTYFTGTTAAEAVSTRSGASLFAIHPLDCESWRGSLRTLVRICLFPSQFRNRGRISVFGGANAHDLAVCSRRCNARDPDVGSRAAK